MPNRLSLQPLGKTLQEAGLISSAQLEVALYDRNYYQDLRIGEILAIRGWIEPKTADFFAESWEEVIQSRHKKPLGFYLKKAALLDEKQIEDILKEQNKIWIRFGSVAVLKGWLKQETLDFFLHNLFPVEASKSSLTRAGSIYQKATIQMTQEEIYFDPKIILANRSHHMTTSTDFIEEEDIIWVG